MGLQVNRTPYGGKTLLAVDPGLRETGYAVFEDGVLIKAGLAVNPNTTGRDGAAWSAMLDTLKRRVPTCDEGAVEMMVIRDNNARADDLLQLVGIAGGVVGLYYPANVRLYRPEEWKGQLKKRIHHPRLFKRLNGAEENVVRRLFAEKDYGVYNTIEAYVGACKRCRGNNYPDEDKVHNVIDAIGIGIAHLGRY